MLGFVTFFIWAHMLYSRGLVTVYSCVYEALLGKCGQQVTQLAYIQTAFDMIRAHLGNVQECPAGINIISFSSNFLFTSTLVCVKPQNWLAVWNVCCKKNTIFQNRWSHIIYMCFSSNCWLCYPKCCFPCMWQSFDCQDFSCDIRLGFGAVWCQSW